MSLDARLRNADLKETRSAKEWIGTLTWSRALYQGANQGFEHGIVFPIVQTRMRALQCLHHHKLAVPIGSQLLPVSCRKRIVGIEQEDVLHAIRVGDSESFRAWLTHSEPRIGVESMSKRNGPRCSQSS